MKPIATFDLETDPFKKNRSPVPFLAGFFDGKTTRIFKGENCVRDCYAVMKKFRGYIYAHNGGKFDFRYLLPYLKKSDAKLKPIKGRAARFVLPNGTEFRDSYCILPISLKATGGKLEMDYRKLEKKVRHLHMDEIVTYLKADLHVLHEKVLEFVGVYGFGMTLSGRTFSQFKENFDMEPPKASIHHDEQFRPFYYGGRVEFFELGHIKGTFKLIDINSAYPAAMVKKHAFGLTFKTMLTLPKTDEKLNVCFVRFVGHSSGGLPFRKADKSLSFAEHTGEFFVTGWELVAARKAGTVRIDKIIFCYRPLECRSFEKFVNHFYRMKKEATKGSSDELFAKLFLNSSYGRFALDPRSFRDVEMTDAGEEPDENKPLRKKVTAHVRAKFPTLKGEEFRVKCSAYWEGFDGKWTLANTFDDAGISIWERTTEIKPTSFFNVCTAASITGCVRAFLFESLRAVKRPVYCDTDSIICETTGNLKMGSDLGEWKIEAESEPDGLWVAAKKLYAMKLKGSGKPWKLAAKGVRLSASEIVRVANGAKITSTLDAPTFSIFTTRSVAGGKRDFVTRTTVRDDRRERRGEK